MSHSIAAVRALESSIICFTAVATQEARVSTASSHALRGSPGPQDPRILCFTWYKQLYRCIMECSGRDNGRPPISVSCERIEGSLTPLLLFTDATK